jgi:hypothetical protein
LKRVEFQVSEYSPKKNTHQQKFLYWEENSILCHRGMLHDIFCPMCNTNEETTLQCLRDCAFVKCFWKSFGFTDQAFFQENNLYSWLRHSIDGPSIFPFLAAVWWLWRARNMMRMENEVMSYFTLRMHIDNYAHLLKKCFFKHVSPDTRMVR